MAAFTKTPDSTVSREITKTALPLDNGALTQGKIIEEAYASLTEEDLFISEEVAINIAQLFINDSIAVGEMVSWDESTEITNVVVMYDETGTDTVTAYSFELDNTKGYNGYIVVAARLDAPNLILEFADAAEPLYTVLDLNEEDQVVYLGPEYYYMDSVDNDLDVLWDLSGNKVLRDQLVNVIEENSDINNIPENVAITIASEKGVLYFNASESSEDIDSGISLYASNSSPIANPFTHANNNYQGPFVSNDYINKWENYVSYYDTTTYDYGRHCGPSAITHLIKWYGKRYNSSLCNTSYSSTLSSVVSYGNTWGYYDPSSGTLRGSASEYIRLCFAQRGVSVYVNGKYNVNYDNVKKSLGDNQLLYVSLDSHPCYNNHAVACFAYTRLKSTSTGWYKTYIKVADSWSTNARYIDMASVSECKYWSVSF